MCRSFRRPRSRSAFTLVELLVVMAIIVVLIALLMPMIRSVRRMVQSTQCLSNLKQLGSALNSYVVDNNGYYPRPAVESEYEDWVYWQSGRNPANGRIIPYLGGLDVAGKVLMCPTDDVTFHTATSPPFPYSYSLNEFICRTIALGHYQTLNIRQIVTPGQTILAICESSATIDDGCWASQNYVNRGWVNLLSNRHYMNAEDRYDYLATDDLAGRGNVVFADGHASGISRADSFSPAFYTAYPGEPAF